MSTAKVVDKEFIIQISLDDVIEKHGYDDFNALICNETHPDLQDIEWEILSGKGHEFALKVKGYVDPEDEGV